MAFSLRSASFEHEGAIPAKHTCQGADAAPALAWSGAPAATKSFALIVDDPDAPDPRAPKTTWVHWVVYNLPAATASLPKARPPPTCRPERSKGSTTGARAGYGGPCPPIGRHRYFHKLYALDVVLTDYTSPARRRPIWRRRCAGTCSRRRSWSGRTRRASRVRTSYAGTSRAACGAGSRATSARRLADPPWPSARRWRPCAPCRRAAACSALRCWSC